MLLNNRSVGFHNTIKAFLAELEDGVGVTIIQIIKENTSKTAGFVSVLNDKVSVSPGLKLGVKFLVVLVAYLFVCSVELLHVILINETGSDISSSTEPPNATICLKVPVVEMHGRAVGVARVHHTGKTTGKERNTLTWSHSLCAVNTTFSGSLKCLLRHTSVHNRKVDSSFLEDLSTGQHTRHTSSTVGTNPGVFLECSLAINVTDCLCDFYLSFAAHFLELGTHGIVAIRTISFTDERVRNFFHWAVAIPANVHRRSIITCLLSLGLRSLLSLGLGGLSSGRHLWHKSIGSRLCWDKTIASRSDGAKDEDG
mmetsp:Transcript_2939/g.4215  ORF Transcript_2939/g.4215 Transcript_2939/m.4215 type:complete len:312 (-) Transcript_2939:96-1031(-)